MIKLTLSALRKSRGCTKEQALVCLGVSEGVYDAFCEDPGLIPKSIACKMRKACGISLDMLDIKTDEIYESN